ncbi:MAG: tRNA pseudouridine(13) synthase TruD [Pseudomonadales bacterium]
MTFSTDFLYVYGKPTTSGIIRASAEDFKVYELSSGSLSGSGEHVYLHIRKTDANTGWVASKIAEFAGIDTGDVGFAGRKDRHAVTEQWFSCYLPGDSDIEWAELSIEGVSLIEQTRHSKKLRKGDLEGNRFELTIQDVHDPRSLETRLHTIRDSGIPNYYGEQRFGHNAGNLDFANRLLKGDKSIRRKRDIYLSAARSYMFNHYLSTRIERGGWDEITDVDEGPLYGMSRDPRPGEELLPAECDGWCDGLQKLRVKTGSRSLKLKPKNLQWRFTESSVQLSFSIPAGSFATSLLRELLNYNEAVVSQIPEYRSGASN